jgi:hypothetical protein
MKFRLAPTAAFAACFTVALVGAILLAPARGGSATPPRPVLVELFTSEGCSSCPPADRLLMDLDRQQPVPGAEIVVLSEHVDYWNSLGWRDPYSSPGWSERQSGYARRFDLDSVYTPQMVVDGTRQAVGNDRPAALDAIRKSASAPHLTITISDLHRAENHVEISYSADAAPNATLYAVLADASDRSSVARGENAGRTLDHVAVARSLTTLASLEAPSVGKTVEIAIPGDDAGRHLRIILFAQSAKNGSIVGVTERDL